jgi:hypothetical protein
VFTLSCVVAFKFLALDFRSRTIGRFEEERLGLIRTCCYKCRTCTRWRKVGGKRGLAFKDGPVVKIRGPSVAPVSICCRSERTAGYPAILRSVVTPWATSNNGNVSSGYVIAGPRCDK